MPRCRRMPTWDLSLEERVKLVEARVSMAEVPLRAMSQAVAMANM